MSQQARKDELTARDLQKVVTGQEETARTEEGGSAGAADVAPTPAHAAAAAATTAAPAAAAAAVSDDDSDVDIVDNDPNSPANILKALKEMFGQGIQLRILEAAALNCGSASAAVEQVMSSSNFQPDSAASAAAFAALAAPATAAAAVAAAAVAAAKPDAIPTVLEGSSDDDDSWIDNLG